MSSDLATQLLPYLEAVANIHYLLDKHVENPERLRELRQLEEQVFGDMLKIVLEHQHE